MQPRHVRVGIPLTALLLGAGALVLLAGTTAQVADPVQRPGERSWTHSAGRDVPVPPAPRQGTGPLMVAGQVLDSQGRPQAGAPVELATVPNWSLDPLQAMEAPRAALRDGEIQHETVLARVVTDAAGRFGFRHLPQARFVVRGAADAPGLCSAVLVDTGLPGALDVTLRAGGGRPLVLDLRTRATALPETVYLESTAQAWRRGPLRVPNSGTLRLAAVPEGPLRVVLRRAGHMMLVHEFVPDGIAPTALAFPHGDGVQIQVDVTDHEGSLIPGAPVWVSVGHHQGGPVRCIAQATSDDDGAAHIEGLPARHLVRVEARAHGFVSGVVDLASRGQPLGADVSTRMGVRLRPGALVSGVVVDAHGRGIAGAQVTVDPRDGPVALSGPDGGILLRGVEPGRRSVRVTHPDYRQIRSEPVAWSARGHVISKAAAAIRLHMARAASAEGRVVDASGSPVGDVLVRVDRPHGAATLTGADGRFRLEGLPCGRPIQLSAHAPGGHRSAPTEGFLVGPGITQRLGEIVVAPRQDLRGRLRTASGDPVRGVYVSVHGPSGGREAIRSGADGSFAFRGLHTGRHTVLVWKTPTPTLEGEAVERVDVRVDPDVETPPLEIRTQRRSYLRGRVTDDAGNPLAGLRVECRGVSVAAEATDRDTAVPGVLGKARASTDGAGRFEIGPLWHGDVPYALRIDGRRVARTFTPGEWEYTIVAPRARAREVFCEIVDTVRRPFEPATVTVDYLGAMDKESGLEPVLDTETLTIAFGGALLCAPQACRSIRFRLQRLQGRAAWVFNEQLLPVQDRMRVTIPRWVRPQEHSYRFRVHDEQGDPVENALVEVAQPDTERTPVWEQGRFRVYATALSDEHGVARVEGLPFDSVRVRVGRTHAYRRSAPVGAVTSDERVLVARPGRSLRGRVVDASGVGVARVEVRTNRAGWDHDAQRVLSDEDGGFLLEGLPLSGGVNLEFHPPAESEPCCLPAALDAIDVASPGGLTVQLERGFLVRGRLRQRDGTPLQLGRFSIQPWGRSPGEDVRTLSMDSRDGVFVGGPVPRGRYRLFFHGSLRHLGAFMEEPIELDVPGDPFDQVVHEAWHLQVRHQGPGLERNEVEIRWHPDEPIVAAGARSGDRHASPTVHRVVRLGPRQGTASIPHVREDKGWVYAVELGGTGRYALHRVNRPMVQPLDLTLREGLSISGRVRGRGVRYLRLHQGALEIRTTTSASGDFFVNALPPGEWTIDVLAAQPIRTDHVLATTTANAGDSDVTVE